MPSFCQMGAEQKLPPSIGWTQHILARNIKVDELHKRQRCGEEAIQTSDSLSNLPKIWGCERIEGVNRQRPYFANAQPNRQNCLIVKIA